MRRSRAMVLDEVWRGLTGVEALSGPHGGPLRRTVKLIVDPLVLRPVQFPACAGPTLTADGALLLTARLNAAADALAATAAWFTLLKQVRRALRITSGNPQDRYFQRCFELATQSGMPDPVRDRPVAEAALRDIHDNSAGRTTQALREYLGDPVRARELTELLEVAWGRRPGSEIPSRKNESGFAELLDTCPDGRAESTLDGLLAAHAGTHFGIRLWHSDFLESEALGARDLGLTAHPLPRRPDVGATASTADLGIAFDRTIFERIFTVLQGSSERADLPSVPDLVTTEVARSCAPWALLDETLRVAATAGVFLAVGLSPFGSTDRASAGPGIGETAAHRVINSRWRREGYVLQARRLAIDTSLATTVIREPAPGGVAGAAPAKMTKVLVQASLSAGVATTTETLAGADSTSAGEPDIETFSGALAAGSETSTPSVPFGPLTAIAAELRAPWRLYLRRLWVRLHGRDVRENSVSDVGELWNLLDGVARSVILDHRMRVKRALSVTAPEIRQ
ncbi:hypothetical protein [Nocardia panacis]|uniref:hypothetical protein n=1 Tax=Nocardia panacis TaxID=2340916 RepID=UPI001EEFC8B3|nr:hypothetical protein [Nocardia panacis]